MSPRVAVVLVNWRQPGLTSRCLDTLAAQTGVPRPDVVVVDNASGDGSAHLLRERHPYALVLENPTNAGFTGGCNTGIAAALERGADLVWLLNNDAVAVPHALARLLDAVADHPHAEFFGHWVVRLSEPERLWYAGGTLDPRSGRTGHVGYGERLADQPPPASPHTDWVTGCSLLVRAATLRDGGLLDDRLFLYKEELDLQLRAARRRSDGGAGMCVLVPEPLVLHDVGATTGTTSSALGHAYMARNGLVLLRRHAGPDAARWGLRWAREFLLSPAAAGRLDLLRATWLGVRHVRRPGPALLAAL